MQYMIETPAALLEKILGDAKALENAVANNPRLGSSKQLSQKALSRKMARAEGLRAAAQLVQVFIDTQAALAADNGALAKHLAEIRAKAGQP